MSPSGHQDLQSQVRDLYLRLPDAGGNDHRPGEPIQEKISIRDLLLRPFSPASALCDPMASKWKLRSKSNFP